MYYNTTRQTGEQLEIFKSKARSQDAVILEYMRLQDRALTRDEVIDGCMTDTPVSSVTRSMNTLLNKGAILKLETMRKGKYGRPQHLWAVNPNYQWAQNNG